MSGWSRKPISQEVDISSMRIMRSEGMTNKQIAASLGISPASVYRYLGKRSLDVAFAEEKNLPKPVSDEKIREAQNKKTTPKKKAPEAPAKPMDIPEFKTEVTPVKKALTPLEEIHVVRLKGSFCDYTIDRISGDISFGNGVIEGLLNKESIDTLVQELVELSRVAKGE